MSDSVEQELREVVTQWDRAMIENDAEAIGRFMTDDWVIVGSNGNVDDKESFLTLVKSGDLTHNVMETRNMEVWIYSDTAVTVSSGISGGRYRRESFYLEERASCVFVKQQDSWKCALTHLSQMDET